MEFSEFGFNRSHVSRENALADAVRQCELRISLCNQHNAERLGLHSHAEHGNDKLSARES